MNWNYYNHAMLPDCAPHETVDDTYVQNGEIWKSNARPLLARWTSDFDCKYETEWWYVIKDGEYDIQSMKAKRRYEITKARKNFDVKVISPLDYFDAMCEVQIAAFSAYPEKYRPTFNRDAFESQCKEWQEKGTCLAAFFKDTEGNVADKPCGYVYLHTDGLCIYFSVQKTLPEYEKSGVNAALVDGVLSYFSDDLMSGKYICDGERSVNHETLFQDYLEKYFGFRKAYCKLNIVYRPSIRWIIPILYAFRGLLAKLDNIGTVHLVNGVLKMEKIKRKTKKS